MVAAQYVNSRTYVRRYILGRLMRYTLGSMTEYAFCSPLSQHRNMSVPPGTIRG